MYKLFLCLRYLLHRRIAIVPILAVMLCVAMDLIVASLMGGFLDKVKEAARGLFGDVVISRGSLSGFGYYDAYLDADGNRHDGLLQHLRRVPQVTEATAVLETGAILRLPNRDGFTALVKVLGIVPDQYAQVTEFQNGLFWEKPPSPAGRTDETGSEQPAPTTWQGPPSFQRVPNPVPGQPPVPLATVLAGQDDPVGIIVGVRVFWPTPDKQARYPRQMLEPGAEPVQLTFLPMYASGVVARQPVMRQFRLVDTSYSRIQQIDAATAYVPFKRLQEYLEMGASEQPVGGFLAPARTSRVLVKLIDGADVKKGRDAIQSAVDRWQAERREIYKGQPESRRRRMSYYEPIGVEVEVWQEANKEYFSAIENQRFISLLMVGIVSLTAVALIWVIFIMIVVEKTKDIGIVKSVGGSAGGVTIIFLGWAAVLGLIGSVLGGGLGYLFVDNINGIERWLSELLNTDLFDPRAYLFDSIPARFKWPEMLWIGSTAVVAAMIGALLPAVRAGRMNPVEALRYE